MGYLVVEVWMTPQSNIDYIAMLITLHAPPLAVVFLDRKRDTCTIKGQLALVAALCNPLLCIFL